MLENEIWKFGRNFPLATFGSERVKEETKPALNESLATRITYFYTLFNPKVRAHGFPILKNKKIKIMKLIKNKRKQLKKKKEAHFTFC